MSDESGHLVSRLQAESSQTRCKLNDLRFQLPACTHIA